MANRSASKSNDKGSGGLGLKKLLELNPDPHREEKLDPDPLKMNADPQPCKEGCKPMILFFYQLFNFCFE